MSAEEKTRKPSRQRKPRPKRTYVHRPNALCITIYSQDGQPVPRAVLDEAAEAVTEIALKHRLLIGLADS